MDVDDFSQQIETLRSRVRALVQRTTSEPYSQQELTAEAFEEPK